MCMWQMTQAYMNLKIIRHMNGWIIWYGSWTDVASCTMGPFTWSHIYILTDVADPRHSCPIWRRAFSGIHFVWHHTLREADCVIWLILHIDMTWSFLSRITRHCVCDIVLQCVAVCCSVLQCVAVCCSVLQCAPNHITHSMCYHIKRDTTQNQCAIRHSHFVWYGMATISRLLQILGAIPHKISVLSVIHTLCDMGWLRLVGFFKF